MTIETRSIDYVPAEDRHGRVWDQGPFWFTGNFQFFTLAIGFIGPSMGLSFGWSALAGSLGTVFGTLFMAFHATQGPVLGLPQMIQSRAQFGYRGVILPLVATIINCTAQAVVAALLVMGGLEQIAKFNPASVLLVMAVATTFLGIYGYNWMHVVFKWLFWVSLPLYAVLSVHILEMGLHHFPVAGKYGFSIAAFMAQFIGCASYNIAYAPFVSDYSRYLKRETKARDIISAVFVGASSSAAWLTIVGAWLATHLGPLDPLVALRVSGDSVLPGLGLALAIDSVVVVMAGVAMSNYSGMLTLLTIVDCFKRIRPTVAIRVFGVIACTIIWVIVVMIAGKSAIETMTLALTIILYALVPWTSINLVDFFFVQRGRYVVSDFFDPVGRYRGWSWRGMAAFGAGWVVIGPLAVLPGVWMGPLAIRLGGIDLAWIGGLVASGLAYYLLSLPISRSVQGTAVEHRR